MENKSLIANCIAKCDQEIEKECKGNSCKKCKYGKICEEVYKLNAKFKEKGYLK